jgi:two-component system sensor histidine kinase PilS (NtrC family)
VPAPAIRVSRLLLLRTVVVGVVLGLSLWVVATSEGGSSAAMWMQSTTIAATLASSIAFGVLLRRGVAGERLVTPMMASDLVVTSLLVYLTGGAQSPYTFLYALTIVAAGALAFRRGAMLVTAASIALAIVVALLAWKRAIALPMPADTQPWEQPAAALVRTLGINVAALVAVGVLAVFLGDQLERGEETLATTRREAADLFTLHQDIVRSLSSGLVTVAPDGTILTANLAATEILRRPASVELSGRGVDELIPGLAALLVESHGELRRADLQIEMPDAEQLTLGVTVSPLRDEKNAVFGRIVSFSDLTELRRLEQHMRRSERLATVGQLAAGVAHEIRNPLAAISGSIELLRAAPGASDDDRALMTIVHREIHRLNGLIGDLLDYANPRPGERVTFDLGVIIDETVQVARGDQAFAEVELACEVERPLSVYGDPAKLRQVVWNLVRNARDAAATGGKHVRVAARAGDDGELEVRVTDDGAGIAADQVAKIFDPFFTTKKGGTGLGLATSHAIVAEHGGRIDVDSEVGAGTTMTVHLPPRDPAASS